eukprot:1161515-Pelagomonas_calceolata.AAC.8
MQDSSVSPSLEHCLSGQLLLALNLCLLRTLQRRKKEREKRLRMPLRSSLQVAHVSIRHRQMSSSEDKQDTHRCTRKDTNNLHLE